MPPINVIVSKRLSYRFIGYKFNLLIMRKWFFYISVFVVLIFNVDSYSQTDSLQIGDIAPSFMGYNQDSILVNSDTILKEHKVVLIFYRGSWCPYCQRHLSALQDSIQFIKEKGAEVVVVTPEKYESQKEMIDKTGATYSIIHDKDYTIMKKYHLDFKISKETVPRYLPFVKQKTRKANENNDDILPIPATYVISQDGTILFKHYDEDYRNRSTISEIINHL